MRDKLRSSDVLKNITELKESTKRLNEGLQIAPKDRHASIKRGKLKNCLEKTIAHYSVGDDKATVTNSLLETIPAFEDVYTYENGGDYEDALWLVSLGVLCDIPLDEFKKITEILQRDKLNDALFTTIIQSKQPDWSTSTKAPWDAPLYGIILKATSAADIKNYLDKKWYSAHKEAYWHDLHKNTRVNNYFGYWSWESAAIAKVKGIEDASLKNQDYYPYDAVHW